MRGQRFLKWFILAGCLVGLIAGIAAFASYLRPVPEEALRRFHAQLNDGQTAEDQLTCPLLLAGPAACPAIIRDIEIQGQPLRRYAIAAIGNLRCSVAAPALKGILKNENERDYFRGDALEALWLIDRSHAEATASSMKSRSDYLGATARRLLGGERPNTRNYWDAVRCTHD